MTTQTPGPDGPVPPAPAGSGPFSPDGPTAAVPGTPTVGFFHAIRGTGLYRSDDRWIGGVAGGIAARFGLDPLLVRGAFLVTLLLGGFGLVIYALAWALLPEQRDGRIHLEGLAAGHPDVALLGALLMFIGGVGNGAWVHWPSRAPGVVQGLFWIATVVLVIVVISSLASRRRPAPPYTGPLPTRGPVPAPFAPYGGPAGPPPVPGVPGAVPHAGPGAPASTSTPPTSSPGAPITMSLPPTAPPPPAPPYAGAPGPYPPQPYRYSPPPVPPRPVPPPAPPTPPRRGPGATTVGITVAVALFVIAGELIARRIGWMDGSTAATAAALIVVVFGVAIIVSGLRGRTSGVLGFLAVVAMVAAIPLSFTARNGWDGWRWEVAPDAVQAGPGTTVIADRESARDGVQVGFGDSTVDLTEVPLTEQLLTVPIELGAGDLTILVPEGARAAAVVDVGAGQVTWHVGTDDASSSGLGLGQQTFGDTTDPQLELRVKIGAGNVTIEEGN